MLADSERSDSMAGGEGIEFNIQINISGAPPIRMENPEPVPIEVTSDSVPEGETRN